MKDLYKGIGLPGHTDDIIAIERAIEIADNANSAGIKAAKSVLLDPEKKDVYDRSYAVLKTIGQLRANLGLSHAPNGLTTDCADFDCPPSTTHSQLDEILSRQRAKVSLGTALKFDRWVGIVIISLVVGVLLLSFFWDNVKDIYRGEGRPQTREAPINSTQSPRSLSREQQLRELVAVRLQRAGHEAKDEYIIDGVQKLLRGQTNPLPATGVMQKNFYGQGLAPLEIKTTHGHNYYVKVVDWVSKREILTAFIRGGQPFETMVPLGSYEIKYAAGTHWYGSILDFGESASYLRCDDRFDFVRSYQGYTGYTIELIMQSHGNLETDLIAPEDF